LDPNLFQLIIQVLEIGILVLVFHLKVLFPVGWFNGAFISSLKGRVFHSFRTIMLFLKGGWDKKTGGIEFSLTAFLKEFFRRDFSRCV